MTAWRNTSSAAAATTPYVRNRGLIVIPAADTWHGFLRRSLIVNYVKPEWRSRHELAFPDQPVLTLGEAPSHRFIDAARG